MATAERYTHRSVTTVFNGRAYIMHHLPLYSSTTSEGSHAFFPIQRNIIQRESCVVSQELLGFRSGLAVQHPLRQPPIMEPPNEEGQLSRTQYIAQILRLHHDPFQLFSAEQEFESQEIGPQRFYNYFVEPEENLLYRLNQPEHTIVYADTGHGKTTLQYHLEADLRTIFTKTLVVSLKLDQNVVNQSADELQKSWLNGFAADFFVQMMELFLQFAPQLKDETIIKQIAQLLVAAGWQRELKRYHKKNKAWLKDNLAVWWAYWGRPSIQRIPFTQERQNFLGQLSQVAEQVPTDTDISLETLFKLARQIGFEQIFLSVDVSGDLAIDVGIPILQDRICPLIHDNALLLKAFLPFQYQRAIETQTPNGVMCLTISWSDQSLQQMVARRLHSAGSRIPSLAWYAEDNFAPELDALLLQKAQKSPRRLLQLISQLINIHLAGSPPTHELSRDDWACMEV